jgi:hypothetical protein
MRKLLGALFLWAGVVLGSLVGIGILVGAKVGSVPWYMELGFIKLTLIAAGGLIAAGAVLQRLGRRHDERERLGAGPKSLP